MPEMVMLNTIMHFFHSPGDYVMPATHPGGEEPRTLWLGLPHGSRTRLIM